MSWSARISMPSSDAAAALQMCRPACRGVATALARVFHGQGADILDADPQSFAVS